MKITAESIPSEEFTRVVKKYFEVKEYKKNSTNEYTLCFTDGSFLTLNAKVWRVSDGWQDKPPKKKVEACPNICLWKYPSPCKKCVEFPNAETMGDDFQNQVRNKFEKMIENEKEKMPLFPELLDDVIYIWQSRQTGRRYKLARHSFKKNKTSYRFFNELRKLQKEKHDMAVYSANTTSF
ncbi:MAG: hypothetical protein HDR52_06165 [Treponema sp.]|nr:hypothetical protein [Treponema sp.]